MEKDKRKKKQMYKSMMEFEEKFFPNSLKERLSGVPADPRVLGISLARESLDAIRKRLAK